MALYDLADNAAPLPTQVVLDSSLLLACRAGDDNPNAATARRFVGRIGQQIANYRMVAWLLMPVLQECYHIILSRSVRHAWQQQDSKSRRPNWLAAYKHNPHLLATGFEDIAKFDEILAAIPVTNALPEDLAVLTTTVSLAERLRFFVTTYHLLPQDALILAEAQQLGVSAVATLDGDWRRVSEFDIFTTPVP